jgi:flagellar basal body rod protein FlgG
MNMNRSSLMRRFAAPLAGVVLVSGLMAVAATSASAAPIGNLTLNNLATQSSSFNVTTSGACPDPATNFVIKLEGGNIPSPASAPNLTGNTDGGIIAGFSTGSFSALSSKTLVAFASANGLPKLGDGAYTITLVCREALASASLGDYVGTFTISNNGDTVTVGGPVVDSDTTTILATSPSTTAAWGASVTLTAVVDGTGTETNPVGTVQFKDGATPIGSPVTVANGPSGTATATTTIVPAATGLHTYGADFVAGTGFNDSSDTADLTVALSAPTLIRAATLSGSIKVGGTAVCNTGTWSGATSYKYEFLKNGVVAQTSTTDFDLVLSAADAGKTLSCRVTGVNPIGDSAPSTTSAPKIALGSAAVATKAPKITYSGSAANVGETLKAYRGVWSPTATYTYNYIWKRGSTVIKQGSTATSYKATAKDKGKKLTLTVQVKRTGYTTATKTSAAVTVK